MRSELADILLKDSEINIEKSLPSISIDCVVFGFDTASLKVLLTKVKEKDGWLLPGGYLHKSENLEDGAYRILESRTGVSEIYLQQFKTFGKLNRSNDFFSEYDKNLWHKRRFLSVGYYALTNFAKVEPKIDYLSEACEWKNINELPQLLMDHQEIFDAALLELRKGLNYRPVGLNLLPEKFTMPELQRLYEIILDKPLNRGNFYRKMTKYGILNKLKETRKGGAHKAPNLYTFNAETYNEALENGFKEAW
ncbi:NUDIX hydrolase [Zunongwangia endophytica]|uniref:NUDIX domain-containing protein n=1 Tax=Zunongwangia endophytica TaxID=1808945 RepID=A0ABV8H1W9_9FLAO|nr:NUDIX domain-containing protein [Zunongwangia endophytica]MDN3594581.1 NUDIX domain-containing protein [Zunongwangia endophytica]